MTLEKQLSSTRDAILKEMYSNGSDIAFGGPAAGKDEVLKYLDDAKLINISFSENPIASMISSFNSLLGKDMGHPQQIVELKVEEFSEKEITQILIELEGVFETAAIEPRVLSSIMCILLNLSTRLNHSGVRSVLYFS